MDHEHTEWRCAVNELTEMERAAYDDPETYSDTFDLYGNRK